MSQKLPPSYRRIPLKINEVRERTQLSRSMLYTLVRRGVLPPPVSLGARASSHEENSR